LDRQFVPDRTGPKTALADRISRFSEIKKRGKKSSSSVAISAPGGGNCRLLKAFQLACCIVTPFFAFLGAENAQIAAF
jgi:hypothetical protein